MEFFYFLKVPPILIKRIKEAMNVFGLFHVFCSSCIIYSAIPKCGRKIYMNNLTSIYFNHGNYWYLITHIKKLNIYIEACTLPAQLF